MQDEGTRDEVEVNLKSAVFIQGHRAALGGAARLEGSPPHHGFAQSNCCDVSLRHHFFLPSIPHLQNRGNNTTTSLIRIVKSK